MSNYFILISDRKISNNLISKRVDIPKSIESYISFAPKYAYIIEPEANDRKELFVKKYSPELYDQTNVWFENLSDLINNSMNDNANIVLIETYYDQNLEQIIWDTKEIPIEDFKKEEFNFAFETIYNFTL